MKPHFVYIISAIKDWRSAAPIKVGHSRNPEKRLATIRTASPIPVHLHRTVRVPDRALAVWLERLFHAGNKDARITGEWFNVDPDVALRDLVIGLMIAVEDQGRPIALTRQLYDFAGLTEFYIRGSDGVAYL